MGLLDALRGLLGGRTNDRSGPTGGGTGGRNDGREGAGGGNGGDEYASGDDDGDEVTGDDDGDEVTGDDDGDGVAGDNDGDGVAGDNDGDDGPLQDPTDPRLQSHGTHWETLIPDEGDGEWTETLRDVVMAAAERGDVVDGADRGGREVRGYRHGDGPLRTVAVTLDGAVATAYPVGEGVEHEVPLTRRVEWESGIEAWVGGSLGPAAVDCFATNYFERPPGAFEGDRTVSLALLAYGLGPAEEETVAGPDGEELSLSGMAGFTPTEWGAVDDVSLRTTVTDVERVRHAGTDAYRLRAPLFRTAHDEGVPVAVYVADHGLEEGYVPESGDDVAGVGWLQGRVG